MAREIAAMARMTAADTGRPVFAQRVMAAIANVPRHRFVSPEQGPNAYQNRPLPIGQGQTISQPYIVALMTDLVEPKPGQSVLEIGTGSGYQAAVLAELVGMVYTIEIVEPLGRRAADTLRSLGYGNIATRIGDGYNGWPEKAPFDSIVVTAAAPFIPQPLIEQLKPGGKLVIPVGEQSGVQRLMVIEKTADGTTTRRRTLPVRFVPLTRTPPAK
ncbi:MAG: protein-L-isoaspartate(D-aspartate) O-methyltransferase [Betaproteobacteria bacterium]|nr:protein-L-isoaspartate(D-aspartate) O-methyltransferase [Betaproteobacteria bacterium]